MVPGDETNVTDQTARGYRAPGPKSSDRQRITEKTASSGIQQDRLRTEHAQEGCSRLAAIVDSSQDAIVGIDLDGRIESWNPGAESLFGYRAREIVGRSADLLVPPDLTEQAARLLDKVRQGEPERQLETVRVTKDGSRVDVSLTVSPIHDSAGRIRRASIFARDIRSQKRGQEELSHYLSDLEDAKRTTEMQAEQLVRQSEELARTRDEALESTRLKSEFLATMSHEIRTPMNGVIGMTDILLDTDLSEEQQEYAQTIRDCSVALLGLINDILDFSKIEAGRIELEAADFDLVQTVEGALDVVAERASSKSVELPLLMAPDVPLHVHGDPGRLRQILLNLLSNAIKFTDEGEVSVSVSTVSQDQETVDIRFSVKDTGIGIPADVQPRLFSPFTQADGSTTRKYGGTGLGLAISQRLATQMGGPIRFDSVPGEGSEFWFTARFRKTSGSGAWASRRTLEGCRVLVIERHRVATRVLRHYLETCGAVVEATEGEKIEDFAALVTAAGRPPDIVILDATTPHLDGLDAVRRMRAKAEQSSVPALLLVEYGRRLPVDDLERLGRSTGLRKPIKPTQLLDALQRLMGLSEDPVASTREPERPEAATPSSEKQERPADSQPSRRRLLLAEDNLVNQKVALKMLSKFGYAAEAVESGLEVLAAMDRGTYDLVLMDCQMPEMDGYQAAVEIRKREGKGRHVPIVALTANAMEGDRERCLQTGMDDYVSKPIEPKTLLATLQRWLPDDSDGSESETG